MRKTHVSPTISSHKKTAPPVNIRDRVIRLTEVVNELKTNAEVEERHKDSIDKVNAQNYGVLSSQIKSLKKAFNTLADVVMEELDSFKSDILKDFQDHGDVTYRKIEDLSVQVHKINTDRQEQKTQIMSLDQDFRERFRSLEKRHEENFEYLQSVLEAGREDNKLLFEKLKVVINNNTTQLDLLSKDNEKIHGELNKINSKTNSEISNSKNIQKRIQEIEEGIRINRQELGERTVEIKEQTNTLRQNKSEVQGLLKVQTDLSRKVEEITAKLGEKFDVNLRSFEQRVGDIDRSIGHLRREFQENLEELAQINKDSSTQIILDFEKAITSLNSDTKVIFKKFGSIEEHQIKSKDELGLMMTEQNHILIRKNELLERAIQEICRKLNIPNPLLSY